jgi:hypothetical protein
MQCRRRHSDIAYHTPDAASVDQLACFIGTFAPFLRASDKPIAIACLRLFTFPALPPFPERSVPFLRLRVALSTLFSAARPYFLLPDFRDLLFFDAILISPVNFPLRIALDVSSCETSRLMDQERQEKFQPTLDWARRTHLRN